MIASSDTARRGARRLPVPPVLAAAVAVAWLVAIATDGRLHGSMHGGGHAHLSLATAPGFIAAWTVMVAAMMLPSAVPMLEHFALAARTQPHPRRVVAVFVAAYLLVWVVFGVWAVLGDASLHHLVDSVPALERRPWLVSGGIVLVAGGFQFTRIKQACLDMCRHPAVFIRRRYARGSGAAFRLGVNHGLFCAGCCWALMLLMFVAGVSNLVLMAVLTGLMVYEKTGRGGARVSRPAGFVLIAWGVALLLHPAWLPSALGA